VIRYVRNILRALFNVKVIVNGTSDSAFGKVADARGKIEALKSVAKDLAADAKNAHADLDDVHKILG
jgi:uncharacterized protein (DUF2147 family)